MLSCTYGHVCVVHSQVTANIEEATERIAAAAQPKLQAMVQHELSRFAADRTVCSPGPHLLSWTAIASFPLHS